MKESGIVINTNLKYRTFSGTDTLIFALFPSCVPICLGSISTYSYSISRQKQQVNLLGHINVGGFTRGTRVVAGSIIFTMINQHWTNELISQLPYLQNEEEYNLKSDELPLFDLMIVSANEYGASIVSFLYGVDIVDDGQVVSIEDLFTENQCRYVARDIDLYKENKPYNNKTSSSIKASNYTLGTKINNNKIISSNTKQYKENSSIYDMKNVKAFQRANNISANGLMSSKILKLVDVENSCKTIINRRKYKVPVFEEPDCTSTVIRYLSYFEKIVNYVVEDTKLKDKTLKYLDYYDFSDTCDNYNIEEYAEFIKINDEGYVRTKDLIVSIPYMANQNSNENITATIKDCINNLMIVNFTNIINDFTIKVTAISYFKNKQSIFNMKEIKTLDKKDTKICTNTVMDAFLYNCDYNSYPEKVEFIVYPIGYTPIKKIIKIVGER